MPNEKRGKSVVVKHVQMKDIYKNRKKIEKGNNCRAAKKITTWGTCKIQGAKLVSWVSSVMVRTQGPVTQNTNP
jgi:hypothetical protein